ILETVLVAYPKHKRAKQLLAKIEDQEASGMAPPPEPAPVAEVEMPAVAPVTEEEAQAVDSPGEASSAFDLAAELAEDLGEAAASTESSPLSGGDDFQYSVEEVFSEFK